MLVLVATTNRGKLREMRAIIGGHCPLLELQGLEDRDRPAPLVNEDQPDFVGNARKKAVEYAQHFQIAVLADDSGLEVDALGGAPGVHSARYAGVPANPVANNRKLLADMRDVADPNRSARFRCALVFYDPASGEERVTEGTCEGTIAQAPRGAGGFGYDPLFVWRDGRTLAEMAADQKNAISHRAAAATDMARQLQQLLGIL